MGILIALILGFVSVTTYMAITDDGAADKCRNGSPYLDTKLCTEYCKDYTGNRRCKK